MMQTVSQIVCLVEDVADGFADDMLGWESRFHIFLTVGDIGTKKLIILTSRNFR
jgi:hypothetical protein